MPSAWLTRWHVDPDSDPHSGERSRSGLGPSLQCRCRGSNARPIGAKVPYSVGASCVDWSLCRLDSSVEAGRGSAPICMDQIAEHTSPDTSGARDESPPAYLTVVESCLECRVLPGVFPSDQQNLKKGKAEFEKIPLKTQEIFATRIKPRMDAILRPMFHQSSGFSNPCTTVWTRFTIRGPG